MTPLVQDLAAFGQVVLIDLTLAGDNAVVVGLAVSGLKPEQKRPAILVGIAVATALRVAFGAITLQLLAIVGLMLAGGLLLLWVCWRMYRDLLATNPATAAQPAPKSLRSAMIQIVLADLSMSLDNVLAVAGAAHGTLWVLIAGVVLSVVLMGAAASLIARLLGRYRWIAWVGLVAVLFVALRLVWEGGHEVLAHLSQHPAT